MTVSRTLAWFVWIIASIFYAYQYILRVMPNIMLDDLMQQFQIDAAVFGQYSGVYYIGYALMHLPIGILLDHYGPRKIMTGCILMTVAGLLPIIFAEHWIYPVMGRALIGMGSSAAILGTFKIIRMSFKEQHFSRMLSFSVMIGLMGAIYGGGPVQMMCHSLGYKVVVEIFAGLGIILAAITFLIVPASDPVRSGTILADIKSVLTNPQVVLLCCSAGFMVGPLEGFADVWGSEFLKQVYGFEPTVAGVLPSLIFTGMCFGSPILSLMAEKTGQYMGVIIAAGIIMLSVFVLMVLGSLNLSTMTLGFVITGACCAYQILVIYKATTYVPEKIVGLTTAIANMIIMSFGYGFHTVMGLVINNQGGPHEPSALVQGVTIIPLALGIGIVGLIGVSRLKGAKSLDPMV